MGVQKPFSNSDWKRFSPTSQENTGRVSCVTQSPQRNTRQNPCGRGDVPHMCSGISFLGSEAPLLRAFQRVQFSHPTPRHANSAATNRWHSPGARAEGRAQGGKRDAAMPEHCSVGTKPVSSGKPGLEENLPPKQRADVIISEGFAPLPAW